MKGKRFMTELSQVEFLSAKQVQQFKKNGIKASNDEGNCCVKSSCKLNFCR